MSRVLATNTGEGLERARFRRAALDALALGEAFALDIHHRMRDRGYDREDLRVLFAQLIAFEQSGLASSRLVTDRGNPRRRFALTEKGALERERLRIP